jgi:hypothetical protein
MSHRLRTKIAALTTLAFIGGLSAVGLAVGQGSQPVAVHRAAAQAVAEVPAAVVSSAPQTGPEVVRVGRTATRDVTPRVSPTGSHDDEGEGGEHGERHD